MVERLTSRDAASTFDALGHPVRTAIVERLAAGQARVTDLARTQPMSLAAVSKHVAILERAGIVRRRVVGRDHWLGLDPRPLAAAREWLSVDAAFWAGRLDALGAAMRDATPADAEERTA